LLSVIVAPGGAFVQRRCCYATTRLPWVPVYRISRRIAARSSSAYAVAGDVAVSLYLTGAALFALPPRHCGLRRASIVTRSSWLRIATLNWCWCVACRCVTGYERRMRL